MDEKDFELTSRFGELVHKLMMTYKTEYRTPIRMPGIRKLTPIEVELLGLLEWQDRISIKEVIRILSIPNSTVTSAVNRLESKGLVVRVVPEEDKRAFELKLTGSGRDIINYRKFKKTQFYTEMIQSLNTEEERYALVELIEKMTRSMVPMTDDRRRRSHMNALEKEYYDFGPWLIEVKELEDIPQQYLTKRQTILDAGFCFKVPIKKEWRNTHPGMLLYNSVIAIHRDKIVILKAVNGEVEETDIAVEDVRYIVHSTDLLDSHIIVATDHKIYDVDYNSVSQEISNHVINMMREYIFRASDKIRLEQIHEVGPVDSQLYHELINRESEHEDMKVLAYQPDIHLERHNPSTLEVLLQTHKKYELQDMVVLTNGKELIIVSRNKEVKRLKDADYSFRHTFMRLDDITEMLLVDEAEMEHLKSLVIYTGDTHISFKVSDEFDAKSMIELLKL